MKSSSKQYISLLITTFCVCNILHFTLQCNHPVDQLAQGLKSIRPVITATGITDLMKAVTQQDLKAIKDLLLKKVDVNAQDSEGNTALHYAVRPRIWCIKGACKRGKGPRIKVHPLHHPHKNVRLDMIKLLLQNGADKTIKNKKGQTPLDLAKDLAQKLNRSKRVKMNQHRQQRLQEIIKALS